MTDYRPPGADASDDEYWKALGSFIENYAVFEAALDSYAQSAGGLGASIAIIVFAGMNVDRKIDFIRRCWTIRPPTHEHRDELDEVFEHAKWIQTVRNSMLHYGSFPREDGSRVTSNVSRALTAADTRVHRVSPDRLMEMRLDILKCAHHLISLTIRPTDPFADRVQSVPVLGRAWLYKPDPGPSRKPRKAEPKGRKK